MGTRTRIGRLMLAAVVAAGVSTAPAAFAQEPEQPTFRTSVAVVPISAVVRDSRNRVVKDLELKDFQVLEQGTPRRIIEFSADENGPLSLAFLFDTSGSMGIASNLAKGRFVITQMLQRLQQQQDEAALFTFHRSLREEVGFTTDPERIAGAVHRVKPWGLTSIYDAIAETSRRVTKRGAVRRAVVVVTDGVDTSSELTAAEVAALASSIDVPVYVVAVVSPLDDPEAQSSLVANQPSGGLRDIAEMTGGDVLFVSGDDSSIAMSSLLATMRHQYFLAIESSSAPGWYPLEVRMKQKGLIVRARRAYLSETAADAGAPGAGPGSR